MDRDQERIIRLLEFMNEVNQRAEPYVFEYRGWVFRKQVGENFPEKDKRVIYSVHNLAGGIRLLVLVSILANKMRIQYFRENGADVQQCLYDAVNQFRESYLELVYEDFME